MCVTICGRFCPDEGAIAGYGNEFGQNIPQSGACLKHTLALDRKDKKWQLPHEINLNLRTVERFYKASPEIPTIYFRRTAGRHFRRTVIEVQITIPDGRTFTSNLKVQQEDIEAVKSLQNYQ